MNRTPKLRQIGSLLGAISPKKALRELGAHGGDPEFAKIKETSSRLAHKYRNALRELAK